MTLGSHFSRYLTRLPRTFFLFSFPFGNYRVDVPRWKDHMCDDRPALEIEVTPEMIEAGVSVCVWHCQMFESDAALVEKVYRAMYCAVTRSHTEILDA